MAITERGLYVGSSLDEKGFRVLGTSAQEFGLSVFGLGGGGTGAPDLAGQGAAVSGGTATAALLLSLSGSAGAQAGGTGTLRVVLQVTGTATAIASGLGVLDLVGQSSLIGQAQAQSGGEGLLSLRLALSGTAQAISSAIGTLRDAGAAVQYVWSTRAESAGWGATAEVVAEAGTPLPTDTAGADFIH